MKTISVRGALLLLLLALGCEQSGARHRQPVVARRAMATRADAGLADAAPAAAAAPRLDQGIQQCRSWDGVGTRTCEWCHSEDSACVGLLAGWQDGDEVFAVGNGIAHSSDGGKSWRLVDYRSFAPDDADLGTSYLTSVWGSSADDVYAVGCNDGGGFETPGVILHSADRGISWQVQRSDVPVCLRHVTGSGPHDVFASGPRLEDDAGRTLVLHSAGDGKPWKSGGKLPKVAPVGTVVDANVRAAADAAFDDWITHR
jgi:hypothetical protein